MLEAIFDRSSRSAAVRGAYQYDTGQRMRMNGLPSPDELLEQDDMLSGDGVAVQVQFAFEGESQTEPRLAVWDEGRCVWTADVPDKFLTRSEPVRVFVEVYYGEDDSGERTKTMYEGVFRPIGRPASSDTVTEEQLAAWGTLEAEVTLGISNADAASALALSSADGALAGAQTAKTAAEAADAAGETATESKTALAAVAALFSGIRVTAESGAAGTEATAQILPGEMIMVIPAGADGANGGPGEDGPTDISFLWDATTQTLEIIPTV